MLLQRPRLRFVSLANRRRLEASVGSSGSSLDKMLVNLHKGEKKKVVHEEAEIAGFIISAFISYLVPVRSIQIQVASS